MSTTALPPTPKSPSVGARRKGPRQLPQLPLSAFTPPNTGTSEQFPLAPSPSSLQPEGIVDAHVIAPNGDLSSWKAQIGQTLGGKIRGVVLSLHGVQPAEVEKVLQDVQSSASSSTTPVLAIAVPFTLEDGVPSAPPSYLTTTGTTPAIVLSTTFKDSSPAAIEALAWALAQGLTINIDVQSDLQQSSGWDSLEELLTKATASPESSKGKVVLCAYISFSGEWRDVQNVRKRGIRSPDMSPNLEGAVVCANMTASMWRYFVLTTLVYLANILPPPDSLALPIVKLLTHEVYRSFQGRTASLSLFANLFVNFLPPAWDAPTPPTPAPAPTEITEEHKEKAARLESHEAREWKRRIKMYIGPTVEAFGFGRIIFGSSPAAPITATTPASNAGDWFELARESFAELGVEQDAIDAVFAQNAKLVYGGSS
ncbi:hypothetical protein C2E23DRAFT_237565 [Lenzites betulinus]|nr:hypothetical protein C2E23DRAFT_237565 [Lenzites betulinus]